jgi:hypothetical protein
MYYRNVKIMRDLTTSYTKLVPSHEIPVLRQVFGPECVKESSGFVVTDRGYPPHAEEYRRLVIVYGEEAVQAAYKTEADMVKEIPLLARVATAVVGFKLPKFGREEKADIPTPLEAPEAPWPRTQHKGCHEGMLDAINKSLDSIPDRDRERPTWLK